MFENDILPLLLDHGYLNYWQKDSIKKCSKTCRNLVHRRCEHAHVTIFGAGRRYGSKIEVDSNIRMPGWALPMDALATGLKSLTIGLGNLRKIDRGKLGGFLKLAAPTIEQLGITDHGADVVFAIRDYDVVFPKMTRCLMHDMEPECNFEEFFFSLETLDAWAPSILSVTIRNFSFMDFAIREEMRVVSKTLRAFEFRIHFDGHEHAFKMHLERCPSLAVFRLIGLPTRLNVHRPAVSEIRLPDNPNLIVDMDLPSVNWLDSNEVDSFRYYFNLFRKSGCSSIALVHDGSHQRDLLLDENFFDVFEESDSESESESESESDDSGEPLKISFTLSIVADMLF